MDQKFPFQVPRMFLGIKQADSWGVSRCPSCSAPPREAASPSKLFWRGWGDTIATLMQETMLRVQPRALVSAC